ncbi:MAG: M1 family metallopeptidase, partial [Lewinella sp.]|nr:M1 family metallopeptidase [Lewinella sp.]
PVERHLIGMANVTYTNHSPDALDLLYLTLLQDLTRQGNIRDEPIPADWLTDGTQINSLKINGQEIDLEDRRTTRRFGTELRIRLAEPLLSGASLEVAVNWEEDLLPGDAGRTGLVDEITYFNGYWYPKITVYDDIDGWDTTPWMGMAEFYSDLSDLEVAITIPTEYTVWATGLLQNADVILPPDILARYEAAATASEPVTIIGAEDREQGVEMRSGIWRFKAEQVPDFAFAFSNQYIWEGVSLPTDRHRVRINSVYPPSRQAYCKEVTAWQREIMRFFSEEMPGIPFPYPAFTSFYKPYPAGGMEFPMMANNGSPQNAASMIGLTAHEMYHMYVPFYVRINEEKYAWMDEGWADFMDVRALEAILGDQHSEAQRINQKYFLEQTLGSQSNVPMITSTEYQTSDNYGYTSYTHPAFIYGLLEDALGTETFQTCLQGYMARWAYKAPTPYDFFFSFNDLSGQDLNWFWRPWFTEWGYPDLAITDVQPGKVTVAMKGNRPMPVEITAEYIEDEQVVTTHHPINVWASGEREVTFDLEQQSGQNPVKIYVNAWLPDIHPEDNYYLAQGITDFQQLADYVGTYTIGDSGATGTITAGEHHLMLESSGTGNRYLLLPAGEDQYATPDGTFTLTFERDAEGQVVGYEAIRLGSAFQGKRL